jgi:hypothetical protein
VPTGESEAAMTEAHHRQHVHAIDGAATDPVCGMTVDPAKTAHHADLCERTSHFCSAVVAIVPREGLSENELLRLSARLERGGEHPLAMAQSSVSVISNALRLRSVTL